MTEDLWLTFTESIEIFTFNTLKGENLPDLPTPGPPRMQILDSTDFPLQFDDIAVSLKSIPNSLFFIPISLFHYLFYFPPGLSSSFLSSKQLLLFHCRYFIRKRQTEKQNSFS